MDWSREWNDFLWATVDSEWWSDWDFMHGHLSPALSAAGAAEREKRVCGLDGDSDSKSGFEGILRPMLPIWHPRWGVENLIRHNDALRPEAVAKRPPAIGMVKPFLDRDVAMGHGMVAGGVCWPRRHR